MLWKTKKGDTIPIDKMSNSHLINSINLLRRKGNYRRLKYLLKEAEKRNLSIDLTMDDLQEDLICTDGNPDFWR